jgi:hypothetical protein
VEKANANPVTVNPNFGYSGSKYAKFEIVFTVGYIRTLKDTWNLGARGLSDCVEGSWRD